MSRPGKKKRRRPDGQRPPVNPPTGHAKGKTPAKFEPLDWALAAGLALLAWLHRLAFLLSNRDKDFPFTIFYQGDTRVFYDYALAILSGQRYDEGIPFHPPGFAGFLSLVYRFLGVDPQTGRVPHFEVKLVVAAVSCLACGFLFLLVRPYLGRWVAFLAGLLCCWHFGLMVLAVAPVTEALYLPLFIGVLLVWTRTQIHPLQPEGWRVPTARGRLLWALLLGMGLAIMALVRAEALLTAMVLLGIGALWPLVPRFRGGSWQPGQMLPWVVALIVMGVSLVPWTLRNNRVLSEINQRYEGRVEEPLPTFVPITLYGPLNLALANHQACDGTFSRDIIPSGMDGAGLEITHPEHLRFLLHGDDMALEFVTSQPLKFVKLVFKKWRLVADAGALGWTQWNFPGGLQGIRRPVDLFVPDSSWGFIFYFFVLVGGVVFFFTSGNPRRLVLITALLTVLTLTVTGLFFGYVRQGLLLFPFFFALAAGGLLHLLQRVRTRSWRGKWQPPSYGRPAVWILSLFVLFLLGMAWLGTRGEPRNYRASGLSSVPGGKVKADQPVRIEVIEPAKP